MKAIEGVDLKVEVQLARDRIIIEKKEKLRNKIASIIGEHSKAEGTVRKLEADLEKAKGAVKRYQVQLDSLEAGDWTTLKDNSEDGPKPPVYEPAAA